MKYVETKAVIAASAEQIWAVLTDAKTLVQADLGLIALDGLIAKDGRLKLRAEVSPKQVFKLKVVNYTPCHSMVWQGGMPFGLFTGRRQFTLRPAAAGTTLYMREEFTGPLSGLIWQSMPDLHPSFDRFVTGVKQLAERKAA